MESKGCHNCEHQYMNHKKCDLPFMVKCNGGNMWEERKYPLAPLKNSKITTNNKTKLKCNLCMEAPYSYNNPECVECLKFMHII